MSVGEWNNNAELIADVARLGYLGDEHCSLVLDPTYGNGRFWNIYRPRYLIACDIDPAKTPTKVVDFTDMPFSDGSFEAVTFDPPYRLNGTPSLKQMDEDYGTSVKVRWQDRMDLIRRGAVECARVVKPGGYLLTKCQDQVVSGRMVWQTDAITACVGAGFTKVDRFDLLSYRPQPKGRSQKHARHNASQLLVFQKEKA